MSKRPEILFPLFSSLSRLSGIGPKISENFKRMGIERPKDMVLTLPVSWVDRRISNTINGLELPTIATVEVRVIEHLESQRKGRPHRVIVEDSQSRFQLVFFHARRNWLMDKLPVGEQRIVSGKLELFDTQVNMVHPDYILPLSDKDQMPQNEAIYPLTEGITQPIFQRSIKEALKSVAALAEWIHPSVINDKHWPSFNEAIISAHHPTRIDDLALCAPARMRLSYDELFAHQMTLALAHNSRRQKRGIATKGTNAIRSKVLAALSFDPTGAQLRAVKEIEADIGDDIRMNRLLQGDVGSGKTLVALLAMLIVVEAKGQAVLMAPTEILVSQHFEWLRQACGDFGVQIDMLTGKDKGKKRAEKLARLKSGETQILIGTHALFQADVAFNNLRLAIIDEQHRFGVRERMGLSAKGVAVDTLVMTATPIPRSLSLALHGDMDVSILDEKPIGRQPIETVAVNSDRLSDVIQRLKSTISTGAQVYWVCPLVETSEQVDWTAAEDRFVTLKAELGHENVCLVHGRMTPDEKSAAMQDFISGKCKVLVATTVIEVGVDVPNATIMIIEQAEKFGLAQLHQLRGRVGRGADKSSCILLYSSPLTTSARTRIDTLRDTNDGFKIAEIDLKLRGAGDLLGLKQSGLPAFKIADIEAQPQLLKMAYDDARMVVNSDPHLSTERGQAIRTLLYLMEQDHAFKYLSVG